MVRRDIPNFFAAWLDVKLGI